MSCNSGFIRFGWWQRLSEISTRSPFLKYVMYIVPPSLSPVSIKKILTVGITYSITGIQRLQAASGGFMLPNYHHAVRSRGRRGFGGALLFKAVF